MRLTPSAPRDVTPRGTGFVSPGRGHLRLARRARLLRTGARVAGLAVTAAAVAATIPVADADTPAIVAQAASLTQVLNNVRDWLMGILATLATVFLTVGGVRYLVAGGDPSEVEKAKQSFRSAGWGYALAALAPLLVSILRGIVGA